MKPRKYKAYPHRFGEGKVHLYLWDSLNKVWYVACRQPYQDPHGYEYDGEEPVNCKRCIKS